MPSGVITIAQLQIYRRSRLHRCLPTVCSGYKQASWVSLQLHTACIIIGYLRKCVIYVGLLGKYHGSKTLSHSIEVINFRSQMYYITVIYNTYIIVIYQLQQNMLIRRFSCQFQRAPNYSSVYNVLHCMKMDYNILQRTTMYCNAHLTSVIILILIG